MPLLAVDHTSGRDGAAANSRARGDADPAGTLPNNPGYLSGWIADPQSIKPGALMPNLDISGPDLANIRSFLLTLK